MVEELNSERLLWPLTVDGPPQRKGLTGLRIGGGAYIAGSPMIKGQPALGFAAQGKSFRAPGPENPKPRGS